MKKQVLRVILMIVGVLTVVVILLSQSFYNLAENSQSKAKSEQKAGEKTGASHISAPADVVPSAAIEMAENIPTILRAVLDSQQTEKSTFPDLKIPTSYFNILFRTIISPNAP